MKKNLLMENQKSIIKEKNSQSYKVKNNAIKETLIRLADLFIDLELEKLRLNQN